MANKLIFSVYLTHTSLTMYSFHFIGIKAYKYLLCMSQKTDKTVLE